MSTTTTAATAAATAPMTTTAAACVLEAFGRPLTLQRFALPRALEPGAMLVHTELAGVCGTDVHLWHGQMPIQLPVILGHETVGRIVAFGAGRDHDWTGQPLRIGDRVTWNSTFSCGSCFYCATKRVPTRCRQRRAYGIGYRCDEAPHFLGGYAEYHYLHPRATVFRLPEEVPNDRLIGAGCALLTAIHGWERAGIEWRDVVVVQGAGPVGLAALAVARNAGAARVLVVGDPAHRLDLAKRFGADATLSLSEVPDAAERAARVRAWTGGHGADVVAECTGVPAAVPEGLEFCRDGGRYLVLGHYCDAGAVALNPHVVTRKQLEIHGSWSSEPRHLQAALEFLRQRGQEFPFESLVTHRHALAEANHALEEMAAGRSMKAVLVPG
jgi:threonine dehydrogenase-like Zn-dependent dehydrogenase